MLIMIDLEKGLIVHNGKLNNFCYGMEHCSLPMQWVPGYVRQVSKAFKAPVHHHVTCPCQGIHLLFKIAVSCRHLSPLVNHNNLHPPHSIHGHQSDD